MVVSTEFTPSKGAKLTANHTSGIRMDASCTPSLPIPGAHLPGILTTATRMVVMTGTEVAGLGHPRMGPSPLESDAGLGWARSPFPRRRARVATLYRLKKTRKTNCMPAMVNLGT